MTQIATRLAEARARIAAAEARYGRAPGSVRLLAVTKARSPGELADALAAGQHAFGESYAQEAAEKIEALAGADVEWHFIGPIQSNKTRFIAQHFAWVHSVERVKIAQRLAEQRPAGTAALEVCLQVNVSGEATKSGVDPAGLTELAEAVATLTGLRLRGLMAIPAPAADLDAQRQPYRALREAFEALNAAGLGLDTLSMGMTDDLEAAIAEGATLVRLGTALFGPRPE